MTDTSSKFKVPFFIEYIYKPMKISEHGFN